MEDYVLYPGEIGRGTNSEVHKGRKTVSTCPAMKGQPLERASEQTVIVYFKNQKIQMCTYAGVGTCDVERCRFLQCANNGGC